MDTRLAAPFRDTAAGQLAEEILRKCVHCGFCNATCPTYQLLGDELDGPRGRIYLIKEMLEGRAVSEKTRLHLDRCLTCRACETTCPSGVPYGQLIDIGRGAVEARLPRPLRESVPRRLLAGVLPRPALFAAAVAVGRALRPLLPDFLAARLPPRAAAAGAWPPARGHRRRMLLLAGCAQPTLAPNINAAAARLFDRLGIELLSPAGAGCCGAIRHHLSDAAALTDMRRNIDAWWPQVEAGVEAIVVTASGCGVQVRDYGRLLADDPDYAAKAAHVGALCRDPAEIVAAEGERLRPLFRPAARGRLAFQSPCTLQHGLKIRGVVEDLLRAAGYELTPVADAHLCCGAAGTYALLQPALAERLRAAKLAALQAGAPAAIATANVGCLIHLQAASVVPVHHWLELLDRATI